MLQDCELQEDECSDFLKDMLFKYIDRCVAVDESSAEVSRRNCTMKWSVLITTSSHCLCLATHTYSICMS